MNNFLITHLREEPMLPRLTQSLTLLFLANVVGRNSIDWKPTISNSTSTVDFQNVSPRPLPFHTTVKSKSLPDPSITRKLKRFRW